MKLSEFFKKMFCRHKYEQTAMWQFDGCISIKRVCTKCGKEDWDIIRY